MTQVITVSPATAAYASEAYKPRNPRSSPMETAISEWHARAMASGDAYEQGILNVVRPPSLQLAFLTSEPTQYQSVSVEHAIAEYAANDAGPDAATAQAPDVRAETPAEHPAAGPIGQSDPSSIPDPAPRSIDTR